MEKWTSKNGDTRWDFEGNTYKYRRELLIYGAIFNAHTKKWFMRKCNEDHPIHEWLKDKEDIRLVR